MFLYNWIITHLAVIMSRSRYPDLYKNMPKRFKGAFLIIPVLGIVVSGYLLILQGWKALLFAAIWMAVGAIVYFLRRAAKREEIDKLITAWPRDRYFS
jgi:APA family basic amino acid/polyamine antiporter